ncbi:uncharacterized protein LOC125178252 [Hyalella azteca]|uniref:Uncharacterized protein LOC125178252 n=1 Tax=Hyalella azteca TaxID=294128 RepID=A0A979FLJ0_HYAAZ|nr:uncharacterized protein LOC125178252 [Hyalella azteca]
MGTNSPENCPDETMGIIPRAIRDLFCTVREREDEYQYLVKCSFVELYAENLYDLLAPGPRDDNILHIREGVGGEIRMQGVTEVPVTSLQETMRCLEQQFREHLSTLEEPSSGGEDPPPIAGLPHQLEEVCARAHPRHHLAGRPLAAAGRSVVSPNRPSLLHRQLYVTPEGQWVCLKTMLGKSSGFPELRGSAHPRIPPPLLPDRETPTTRPSSSLQPWCTSCILIASFSVSLFL